jgi:hypothetical protein
MRGFFRGRPVLFQEDGKPLMYLDTDDGEDDEDDVLLASSGLNASRGVESVRPGAAVL